MPNPIERGLIVAYAGAPALEAAFAAGYQVRSLRVSRTAHLRPGSQRWVCVGTRPDRAVVTVRAATAHAALYGYLRIAGVLELVEHHGVYSRRRVSVDVELERPGS